MPQVVAAAALDMGQFFEFADLLGLFEAADVLIHTSTTFQIKDVDDTQEVLTLTGTFGGYNGGLYPTTGTITGISYSGGNTQFDDFTVSGAWISVEDFTDYVNANAVFQLFAHVLQGADQITGGQFADHLYGFDGNDVINGGGGADVIFAGNGDDIVIYDPADMPAQVDAGSGTDTLLVLGQAAPTTYNLAASSFEGAEVRFQDMSGFADWNWMSFYYDVDWQMTARDVSYANGSSAYTAFDVANSQTWSEVYFNYNIAGQQISEDYRYDDGGRSWVAYDAAGNQSWSQVWFTYNAAGEQVSEDYRYDDGKRSWVSIDAGNIQNWQQVWFTYDASGNKVSEDYRYDDGGRSWVAFDGASNKLWDHIWFTYDAAGHQTSEDRYNDNGTRIWTAYDANSNQAWSQSAFFYDNTGHLYQQVVTWDDGSTSTVNF